MARKTLEIYAPIAHRLGMGLIRNELEDLSFRVLEPESFLALQKEVSDNQPLHQKFLEEVQAEIRTKLLEIGIPAELEARGKGLCSLHRKLHRQHPVLDPLYTFPHPPFITHSERPCYSPS